MPKVSNITDMRAQGRNFSLSLTCASLLICVSKPYIFMCADTGLSSLNLMSWLPSHANVATCGLFHQAGADGHLCHRKTLSSPLIYNKSTPMAYLSTHSSYSFSLLLRGDTITFAFALGSSMANFAEVTQGFYFPSCCHSCFTINFPTHLSSTGLHVSSIVPPQKASCPVR